MTKINIKKELETKSDSLILGLFEDELNYYEQVNPELDKKIQLAVKRKKFSTKKYSYYTTQITNSAYESITVINLGKKTDMDMETLRVSMSIAVKEVNKQKLDSFTTNITDILREIKKLSDADIGLSIAEGIILSSYKFDKYLKTKNHSLKEVSLQWNDKDTILKKAMTQGIIISEATNLTRDLVNEPSNVVNPSYIEKICRELAKKNSKLKIKVLGKKELQAKKMNGILSVSNGGNESPRLIILEYNNNPRQNKTAIVGKGVTFDTGGINLKPEAGLIDMKMDMGGAAAIIGTMKAVCELDLKQNIIGVIPTCENMISGTSYKPGDIITMYNGSTVEIHNTDAEGRMILADAITYADKDLKASTIIDIATLTGACMVALGYEASGLISKDENLISNLFSAGERSKDRVWPLPFYDEYQNKMDGDLSDYINLSREGNGKLAGAITAGVFLSKFVKNANWAHIDIAGPAYIPTEKSYNPKYGTGAGTRLLVYYFLNN